MESFLSYPSVSKAPDNMVSKTNERLGFLRSTDLFAGVTDAALERIVDDLQDVRGEAGETIFGKGDDGDAVYVIVTGRLRLDSDGVHLVTRTAGECVGEFALIDEGERSATASAETDVHLLRWGRPQFQRALAENPDVARGIFRILTTKLREDISIHVDYAIEKERWRQDLQRAREIQMGMLPEGDLETEHLMVSGFCQPAVEVGGDYYDYVALSDDKLGIIVGDVTGHGFYSGLLVAMAKSCLHTLAEIDNTPDTIMHAMRQTLSLSIQRRLLMSCCYALIDPRAGKLCYANAGHPYPYHYRAESGRLEELPSLDPILGALEPEASSFQLGDTEWDPGDVLVMYTDGVTEERDVSGHMFGHGRLEQLIKENAPGSSVSIKRAILDAIDKHAGAAPQSDDLTLVVAKAV